MSEASTPVDAWVIAGGRRLELTPWSLMGILNATPDSFSDGGRHLDPAAAIVAGTEMVRRGATILDVGGESTRPGATRVDAAVQIDRVVPVVAGLRGTGETADTIVSVDTTRAVVAQAAIDAGAAIVNDVSGGTEDPDLLGVVAAAGAGVVLMHRLRPPDADSYSDRYASPPTYDDVVDTVRAALDALAARARDAGVPSDRIAVDPGFGFGKTVAQNFELLHRLDEIVADGRPVLVGSSRKSFLGAVSGEVTPESRTLESLVSAIEAWRRGARLLRVHDVDAHRRGLSVAAAVAEGDRWTPASEVR